MSPNKIQGPLTREVGGEYRANNSSLFYFLSCPSVGIAEVVPHFIKMRKLRGGQEDVHRATVGWCQHPARGRF